MCNNIAHASQHSTCFATGQVYQWPSGASYQGGVLNGKRSGFGTMHFAGTDVVYTGQWLNSKRHGQGKLVFDKAENCFYEGSTQVSMTAGSCLLQSITCTGVVFSCLLFHCVGVSEVSTGST